MYLDLVFVIDLHVYSCLLCLFTLMHVCLEPILFHALEVEFIAFKFKFSYISTCVVIYHQKGGDCNHLGPFAPLVRVCFGDK
jgi:hypothetical protein